jgi:hypothetical protein
MLTFTSTFPQSYQGRIKFKFRILNHNQPIETCCGSGYNLLPKAEKQHKKYRHDRGVQLGQRVRGDSSDFSKRVLVYERNLLNDEAKPDHRHLLSNPSVHKLIPFQISLNLMQKNAELHVLLPVHSILGHPLRPLPENIKHLKPHLQRVLHQSALCRHFSRRSQSNR